MDEFSQLWERRTTLQGTDGTIYELMSLPDLVQAKKTQRDKDWPMIPRLVEAHHASCREEPTGAQIDFWLREARTSEQLIDIARRHPGQARQMQVLRPLLSAALKADPHELEDLLAAEEHAERQADKAYWEPLKRELERMRRSKN